MKKETFAKLAALSMIISILLLCGCEPVVTPMPTKNVPMQTPYNTPGITNIIPDMTPNMTPNITPNITPGTTILPHTTLMPDVTLVPNGSPNGYVFPPEYGTASPNPNKNRGSELLPHNNGY